MLTKYLAAPAILAAASLAAMPAEAVELPITNKAPVEATSHYGPWITVGTGWGWGGHYRGRHHRRGSTVGDILTGVLILGTVAAVANAASKANQRRSYPYRYPQPYPYPERRDYRSGPQGIEGAADLCLREVDRDARAREVTRVERNAGGWLVTGEMADGAGFTCSIGANGRIESVEIGGRAQGYGTDDRQYNDERYRSERAETERLPEPEAQAEPETRAEPEVEAETQPTYPGGPLPGEEVEPETPPVI